jgi:hypothetical protein
MEKKIAVRRCKGDRMVLRQRASYRVIHKRRQGEELKQGKSVSRSGVYPQIGFLL